MPTPTYILGISAYYHDSAACLLRDRETRARQTDGQRDRHGARAGPYPIRVYEV